MKTILVWYLSEIRVQPDGVFDSGAFGSVIPIPDPPV